MSSNSKGKGAKRKRSTQSLRSREDPLCMNCKGRGNTRYVNTHETAFCAYQGGRYEGRFLEAQEAAKAAKEADKARKIRLKGQPTELEREVDSLKNCLFEQMSIISNAEKRTESVVRRMEKLEQRVKDLDWYNANLTGQCCWSKCKLEQWEDWYNDYFHSELNDWFFSSFSFTEQGNLMHSHVEHGCRVLGTGQRLGAETKTFVTYGNDWNDWHSDYG